MDGMICLAYSNAICLILQSNGFGTSPLSEYANDEDDDDDDMMRIRNKRRSIITETQNLKSGEMCALDVCVICV
jgi:hypothetical protein